jgi:hypothetical protein
MEWLEKFSTWLRGSDFDTFSVRWQKTGSRISLAILVACSLFFGLVKLRELISHRKNTIDRSLEYDIAEWIQGGGGWKLVGDVDAYEKVLPNVFRRAEYGRIRQEYETTLSATRKEALFGQALILVHQEIAFHQVHREEKHDAPHAAAEDPRERPSRPGAGADPQSPVQPATQPGAAEDTASGFDCHERLVTYYHRKYSAMGFTDAEIDDLIVRILEDR